MTFQGSSAWVVCHVRPGFEAEAEEELLQTASALGFTATRVQKVPGLIGFEFSSRDMENLRTQLRWSNLIFTRQLLWSLGVLELPENGDRVSPIVEEAQRILPIACANAFSGFFVETPDEDEAKELSKFCKSISRPLENQLNRCKVLPKGKGARLLPRLHVVLTGPQTAWVCFADVGNSSAWSMGIPRLRFPSGAPSRSTLKLEEAFHVFLPAEELDQHLRRGMTAVDLGACPGGWTYQFVSRGIKVFAIDNGAIDPELMETGLVTHRREDAFHFKPSQLVDWLVCDVVEQPASIADLMLNWFLKGWTTRAIFNLKLPMKQRLKEVQQCLEHLKTGCDKAGLSVSIACKQLYHDRKEVTVYMSLKA